MYLQYALPGQAGSQLQPTSMAYDLHAGQMTAYGSSSDFQPRAAYTTTDSTYNDYESRKIPEISTTYEPQTGTNGSRIYVYLDSTSDLLDPSPLIVSLMFAKRRIPASLTPLKAQAHDDYFKYVVKGNAPMFSETESSNPLVLLRLQFQEATGLDAGLADIGLWRYEDERQLELRSSPEITRKRKNILDPQEASTSAKRVSPTETQIAASDDGSYSYASNPNLTYPRALHSIDLSSMQRKLTPYGRSQNLQDDSTNMGVHSFSGDFKVSQSLMKPPMTQTPSYNPSYLTLYPSGRSPRPNPTPCFQMSSSVSPNPANPPLVRASTLQQQSSSISTPAASSNDGIFNPYAMYPDRAIIKIRGGDLDSMQDSWTADERAAKRRLVRFQGEQDGSTINTYFKAVKPEDRPSSHETRERRVSCIYWEERDSYFVTSVDTIALLETLVGARFTVEEKNRIRRNLETHHPLTVSKAKPDTESFFKVIMGLPNPKPRNIEKDVKVFPWPVLGQALTKVISKYVSCFANRALLVADLQQSASPASTVGPLPTSRPLKYSGARSDTSSDRYTHLSSRSSTGSSTYVSTLSSSTLSPPTPTHGLPTQYSEVSPLSMSVPGLSQSYTVPGLASQYSHDDGRSSIDNKFTGQTSLSDLSPAYSGYTTSAAGRRRSSEAKAEAYGTTHYPTRPRANTSFPALYQAAQDPSSDYSLSQMPSAVHAGRDSLDITAFLRSEFGSFGDTQGTQYRLPSRQNSQASQYPQANTETSASQWTIQ